MRRNRNAIGQYFLMLCCAAFSAPAWAEVEVETTRIGHGVQAWYASSPTVPVVDVLISFDGAGYASDSAGKEGRAALAAAMLTEGAGNYDALAFQRALEDGAIELSASSSADQLTIHVHALRDQAMRAGELLALALGSPRFAESDLARVKASTLNMLRRAEEIPDYVASRALAERAFMGHPYANPPYGTAQSVAALTAEDLQHYLTAYATHSNVTIAAAGDVDASLLDDMLEPVVDALTDADVEVKVVGVAPQSQGQTVAQTMDVPQTVVQFIAPALPRDDKRFYALYLLNDAVGGQMLTSRLSQAVRQKKGLVYGINTGLDMRAGGGYLTGSFATRTASVDEAMNTVKQELSAIASRGITTEMCDDARTYAIGSQAMQLDSSAAIASMLMSMQIYDLGEDYLTKRERYFTDVSCSDINALAEELLDPSRFLFVTVGGGQ